MKVFADFEYNGQPNLETIQFGIVLTDENCNVISTYNSLVHPILPITPYVEKLTGISNINVEEASDFPTVFSSFLIWLKSQSNCNKLTFYAWGEDWKQFRRECKMRKCLDKFDEMMKGNDRVNYQKKLSRETLYQGQMMTKSLKLDDVKKLYSIPNDVSHDALSDAMDLMQIYKAVEIEKKKYQEEELKRIFEGKQPHMKRMKETHDKQTYNMFRDLIEYGEFRMYIDNTLYRKLKSGAGEFYTDIEITVADTGLFSKQCLYKENSVFMDIKVENIEENVVVNYKVHHYSVEGKEKTGEFQLKVTDENRRYISRILHQGLIRASEG